MSLRTFGFFASSVVVSFLVTAGPCKAGQLVGNGGIVVDGNCFGTGSVTMLLDYYESRAEYGLDVNLGVSTASVMDKVHLALGRLAVVDSARAAVYTTWADAFQPESIAIPPGTSLSPTEDYGQVFRRADCLARQVIVQTQPTFAGSKRYFIDQPYFQGLSTDDQAGLILHEVVYRDAIMRGHINSKLVRYFVAQLSSSNFASLTASDYETLLLETGLDEYRWQTPQSTVRVFIKSFAAESDATTFCRDLAQDSDLLSFGDINSNFGLHFTRNGAPALYELVERRRQTGAPALLSWISGSTAPTCANIKDLFFKNSVCDRPVDGTICMEKFR